MSSSEKWKSLIADAAFFAGSAIVYVNEKAASLTPATKPLIPIVLKVLHRGSRDLRGAQLAQVEQMRDNLERIEFHLRGGKTSSGVPSNADKRVADAGQPQGGRE